MKALLPLASHHLWPWKHQIPNSLPPNFSESVRSRLLYVQENPIKKQSAEQYLCSIGKIFSSVGTDNPRHKHMGKLDFCLGCHLTSYRKEDYLPERVRPLPVKFIKPSTPTSKEQPQGTSPSATSHGSPYSSSSVLENTEKAEIIPPTTCL